MAPRRNLGRCHLHGQGGAPCLVWLGERSLGVTLPTMLPHLGWTCLIWEWPGPTLCGETGFSGHSGQFLSLCFCVPHLGHRRVGGTVRRLSESTLTLVEASYQGHLEGISALHCLLPVSALPPPLTGRHPRGRGNADPPSAPVV